MPATAALHTEIAIKTQMSRLDPVFDPSYNWDMTEAEFRKLVVRIPFRPIRITLESGSALVVRHLEGIGVAGGWAVVDAPGGPEFFELTRVVSVRHLRNGKSALS